MSDEDELFWPPVDHGTTEPLPSSEHVTEQLTPEHSTVADGGPRPPRRWTTAAIVGVTAFVFGGGGVAIGAALSDNDSSSSSSGNAATVPSATAAALSTSPKSFAAIAAAILPSVVSINVTTSDGGDTGSGIILRQNGYILTNNHVVTDATNGGGTVSVNFNDGTTAPATIVGTDSLDDLAVIKVNKSGLTPAVLGNSSQIAVGDPVLAVGSPLGLSSTVTQGIVSALNRPVETQAETQPQQTDPFGFGGGTTAPTTTQPTVIDAIQTDAAINPGNSGGALVDAEGQVIGVNSAIASLSSDDLGGSQSGNIGVGFAIPIDQAKVISQELITTGHAVHPLLGVTLVDSTPSTGVDKAVVHSVTAGGPADKAGLKVGDVITSVNGQQTAGSDAVIAAVRTYRPGQRITITYQRGGTTQSVPVTLTTETSTQS